jgi:hypothetical protein
LQASINSPQKFKLVWKGISSCTTIKFQVVEQKGRVALWWTFIAITLEKNMIRGEKKCGILGRKGLLANKMANVSNENDLEWKNTKK